MSPEALLLTEHRVALESGRASQRFARTALQRFTDFSSKGAAMSSAMVTAIRDLSAQELTERARSAWEISRRLMDADDSSPDDETRAQIVHIIARSVNEHAKDVDDTYIRHASRMQGNHPSLDDARADAIALACSELDIDLLQRRGRRLPLGDVLRAPRYAASLEHWGKARAAGDPTEGDALGALREGILAIEALAKVVTPGGGATLGDCIKSLRSKKLLDPGADKILEGLWTYANALPGSRHGGTTVASLTEHDWHTVKPILEGALTLLLGIDTSAAASA